MTVDEAREALLKSLRACEQMSRFADPGSSDPHRRAFNEAWELLWQEARVAATAYVAACRLEANRGTP